MITEQTYLVILALITDERLFELFLPQRNARRAFARVAELEEA